VRRVRLLQAKACLLCILLGHLASCVNVLTDVLSFSAGGIIPPGADNITTWHTVVLVRETAFLRCAGGCWSSPATEWITVTPLCLLAVAGSCEKCSCHGMVSWLVCEQSYVVYWVQPSAKLVHMRVAHAHQTPSSSNNKRRG
jgi:hypothetical protein